MFLIVAILFIVLFVSSVQVSDSLTYICAMMAIFTVGTVYGLESIATAINKFVDTEKKKDAWSKDSSDVYDHDGFVDDCR